MFSDAAWGAEHDAFKELATTVGESDTQLLVVGVPISNSETYPVNPKLSVSLHRITAPVLCISCYLLHPAWLYVSYTHCDHKVAMPDSAARWVCGLHEPVAGEVSAATISTNTSLIDAIMCTAAGSLWFATSERQ